ncbi:galactose-3-O-sulfotransferase 3-like [Planococcus citri]|uniref:galactose-3-O-sulfotransferase 3-like n=1 Tax=Planococcus citri TaxID=170843 RepID=UPI0031F8DC14
MHLFVKKTCRRLSCLLKKRVIIFSSICIPVLILLGIQFMRESPLSQPFAYECCPPTSNYTRTNLYFLKTHKTGGTTVKSVMVRFAIKNSIDTLILRGNSYNKPFSNLSLHPQAITPNYKFHMFGQHVRYDSNMKLFQYPDTSMITILRHPATLFRSMYTFFRLENYVGMTFQEFLNAPVKPAVLISEDSDRNIRGYNQMSLDLGFDSEHSNNQTAVTEFIMKIDREFDLVMIMEYMDESFVMLANLMGWPLEYVAFLKLNSRPPGENTCPLTKQDELTLMELNHVDTQLYNYFHEKFLRCKRQYGEDNLNQQVEKLQIINKNFEERCVAEEVIRLSRRNTERIEYIPKNMSDMECVYSLQTSAVLSQIIRNIQIEKLNSGENEVSRSTLNLLQNY